MPDEEEGQPTAEVEVDEDVVEYEVEDEEPEGGEESEGTISASAIPEDMRDQPPEYIRRTFEMAQETLNSRTQEAEQLRQELQELRAQMGRPAPVEDDDDEEDAPDLKDQILDDPEAAIDRVVRRRYGGRIQGIEQAATSGVFMQARASLDNFEEYEDDVKQILQQGGVPVNAQSIEAAYKMAIGNRQVENWRNSRKERDSSIPPSEKKSRKRKIQLTRFEDSIRRGLRMTPEEYQAYKEEQFTEMDVPMSPGRGNNG